MTSIEKAVSTPLIERLEVTQADREAATNLLGFIDFRIMSRITDDMRTAANRAFARHRINAVQTLESEKAVLREALEGLLAFAEDAETKALVGDEGCLWPVEQARVALTSTKEDQA